MNYRERMRKYLEEPSINGSAIGYGKWCALNPEQRKLITKLLDEMDNADVYIRRLQEENEKIKKSINEENCYCDRTDCIGRIRDSRKYPSVYQEKEDYKSRCEKTIEYIEEHKDENNYVFLLPSELQVIQSILDNKE